MTITGSAGKGLGTRNRQRLLMALVSACLLLAVQTGLAHHVASHAHGDEDISDCSLCVLGSHFVADEVEIQFCEMAGPVGGITRDEPNDPAESSSSPFTARGPPTASV